MQSDLIFDLGLHLGEDTTFYLKKGFRVVAVEANPSHVAQVTQSLKRYIVQSRLTIVPKAIAAQEGEITFHVSDDVSIWGTTDEAWVARNEKAGASFRKLTVPATTFNRLLSEYGVPYYLKIDIEGADTLCLEDLLTWDDTPKFVSIESSITSFEDLVAEFSLLQRLGYTKYKIVPQHLISRQKLPIPAREGMTIDYTFPSGSSGAFGHDLPGEWIDLETALRRYMAIFRKYRLTGPNGSLSRLTGKVVNTGYGARTSKAHPMVSFARQAVWHVGVSLGLRAGWYDTHAMRE